MRYAKSHSETIRAMMSALLHASVEELCYFMSSKLPISDIINFAPICR
jgi:hypothetical protein